MTFNFFKNIFPLGITILGFIASPTFAAEQTEKHELENPRIVVQENLQELPDVTVVAKAGHSEATANDKGSTSESTGGAAQEVVDPTDDSELAITPATEKVLKITNELMETARLPLTYIQEHVPFLTKRGTIFFGRLELDAATLTSTGARKSGGLFE